MKRSLIHEMSEKCINPIRILRNMSIILWIVVFILTDGLFAQSTPRVRLYGTVIDESTGEPLHFVNVFISGTTMGAATDQHGAFSIVNVPLGTYELVVSMIGYEMQIIEIRLIESTPKKFNFKLRPIALEAPELEVEAPFPHEWRRHFRLFRHQFIGSSANAAKCLIKNPEALDFKYDARFQLIKASAIEPLEIENNALGYRIYFYLEDFTYRSDGSVTYWGRPMFEPMISEDDKKNEMWRQNRIQTYEGSLRHFLVSAIKGDLSEQGFIVSSVEALDGGDKSIHKYRMTSEDIISSGLAPFERQLTFPYYLKVIYTREVEPEEFAQKRANQQTSYLYLKLKTPVTINTLGNVQTPYALKTYGFWAWERFADTLPLDYMVEDDLME